MNTGGRPDKPVNVLYLIRTWAFGGSHTIVLHLLQHLPKDRFRIICVPFETWKGGDEQFIREAAKRGLDVSSERIPWMSRTDWGKARRKVSDLVSTLGIQLIHTHDPHSNVLVGLGRKRWPCACVASAYGWWNGLFPLRRCLYTWIERQWALPQFDRVITVSDHMKGKILRGPARESRIRVVHTGLDLARSDARSSEAAATRRKWGVPDDAVVVGTLSRVSSEKGHRYLLDAAACLADEFPKLHILIVGDGPARPGLEEHTERLGLRGRVTFTGFVDDAPGALATMDIFAQPSVLEEGFPTAILEAETVGLPVVASAIGGTAETMDVPCTGLLVPPRDAHALANALGELVRDSARRAEMGRSAREFVTGSFTLEAMIAQVAAVYDEALSGCAR